MDKKDRNKKREKNKYGETFSTKERRLNSPKQKKKTSNWKKYLEYTNEENE